MVDGKGRVKNKRCHRCRKWMRECTVGSRNCTSAGWIHVDTMSHYCEGHSMEANSWKGWQIKRGMTRKQYEDYRDERIEVGYPV